LLDLGLEFVSQICVELKGKIEIFLRSFVRSVKHLDQSPKYVCAAELGVEFDSSVEVGGSLWAADSASTTHQLRCLKKWPHTMAAGSFRCWKFFS
jgi:hypothetical protein